mgnify:CR=1 FL=1
MNKVLRAIAEPRRRDILSLVRGSELTAGEIAARFPEVTPPAISQHLKVLAEAGLVSVRRQGTRRLYRAQPDNLLEVMRFLEGLIGPAPKLEDDILSFQIQPAPAERPTAPFWKRS